MPADVLRLFVFARHAESVANAANMLNSNPSQPAALTARGRTQARALGAQLANLHVDLAVGTGTVPDDAVQVIQGSHAGKVSFHERHAEPDAVRVGVIEPGQHDTVVHVDALARPRTPDIVPGGDDPSVEDGNGVHDGRLGVTGVDPPVLDDQIDHHLP